MHYDRLALLLDETFSMEMLATLLKERFAKNPDAIIEGDSTNVTLRCDTWTAHFEMDNEPHVAEECQELAADHQDRPDHDSIHNCRRRIVFWADSNPDGHYLKEICAMQRVLETVAGIVVFDPHDGTFTN